MKLSLQLSDADRVLSNDDLANKAQDVLRKALNQVQPGLANHVHSHDEGSYEGRGGEVRVIGDLTDLLHKAYDARCERMLKDISALVNQ